MGIDPRTIDKRIRDAAGITLVGGRARGRLLAALAGYAFLSLSIDPPTVTHHDKKIQKRGGHLTLRDSPALRAARETYLRAVPERAELIPLVPPVALHVSFRFRLPADWRRRGDRGPGWFHIGKPDVDNLVKTVKDLLAQRGYLADDSQVAMAFLSKRWTLEGGPPGVFIYCRTLVGPGDDGRMLRIARGDEPGRIYPLPPGAGVLP